MTVNYTPPDWPETSNTTRSITIETVPIAFDHQCELQNFLADYLPPVDSFFCRETNPVSVFTSVSDPQADLFSNLWPELPPLKLGSLQWPVGVSRYARALFAIDYPSLIAIAKEAWRYEPETEEDENGNSREKPITDSPDLWGTDSKPLTVKLNGNYEVTLDMYALPPMRITAGRLDLVLLPLVDKRWFWVNRNWTATPTISSWKSMIDSLCSELGRGDDAPDEIDAGDTQPDLAFDTQVTPVTRLLDAAAFSTQQRIIVDGSGKLNFVPSLEFDGLQQRMIGSESDNRIIAGGKAGKAAMPGYLSARGRRITDYYPGCEKSVLAEKAIDEGDATLKRSLYVSYFAQWDTNSSGTAVVNEDSLDSFKTILGKFADDYPNFVGHGHWYCFAGIPNWIQSGHDDYFEVCTIDRQGSPTLISRVVGLPVGWYPQALLIQKQGFWAYTQPVAEFTLSASWSSGSNVSPLASFVENPTKSVRLIRGASVTTTIASGTKVVAQHVCGKGWVVFGGSGGGGSTITVVTGSEIVDTSEGSDGTCGTLRLTTRQITVSSLGSTGTQDAFYFDTCGGA